MTAYSQVAIIGGGLSGTTIAIQQMLKVIEQKTLLSWTGAKHSPVDITIFDQSGIFGPGEPYRAQAGNDLFLLNQPVYAMSPFPDQPDHFTNWLSNNGYSAGANDFVSRQVYGKYLKDVFDNAVGTYEKQECGHIHTIRSEVTDIERLNSGGCRLVTQSREAFDTSIVVLAPGHSRSDLLCEYQGHPRYFDAPYDAGRVKDELAGSEEAVLIVGTSQSMLDALAVLDHADYRGSIHAVSRNLSKPWLYDAERERNVKRPYEYRFLTAEILSVPSAHRYEDLKQLFDQDIQFGLNMGYPMGHLLSRFNPEALSVHIPNGLTQQNFEKLKTYANALYGNPTSPQRFYLMHEFEKSGQLVFEQCDIKDFKITPFQDGFELTKGDMKRKFSALFNSASYSMKAISDHGVVALPLLDRLSKRNALKRHSFDKNAFAYGQQNWPELYLAGPSCNSQRWGAETFRNSLGEIALDSLANLSHH